MLVKQINMLRIFSASPTGMVSSLACFTRFRLQKFCNIASLHVDPPHSDPCFAIISRTPIVLRNSSSIKPSDQSAILENMACRRQRNFPVRLSICDCKWEIHHTLIDRRGLETALGRLKAHGDLTERCVKSIISLLWLVGGFSLASKSLYEPPFGSYSKLRSPST